MASQDVEGTEQVTGHVTAHVAEHVTDQVVQLLHACEGEQSRAELMSTLGLVHREHFRESHLVAALAAGYLEMTIPDKAKNSRQKYRLTPAGHAFLKTLFIRAANDQHERTGTTRHPGAPAGKA